MAKRNADIDLFKFLFSWIIVLYHLTAGSKIGCVGGFFGVDYFLLVSGFFMFSSYERQRSQGHLTTPGAFFRKRFLRFFPWGFTAFLMAFVILRVGRHEITGLASLADSFSEDIWEILMLKWCGINEGANLVNGPAWTLCSMLLAGFLIWGCLYYLKDIFTGLIMPATLMLGFALWRHLPLASFDAWIGFTTFGTLRAWLDLCLGYYCVLLSRRLSGIAFNRRGKALLSAFELLSMAAVFVLVFFRETRYWQWTCTLIFMADIAIASSGHSLLNQLLCRFRFLPFLGEFSFSLFLVHAPLMALYRHFVSYGDWTYMHFSFFALAAVISLLHLYGTRLAIRLTKTIGTGIKKRIVVNGDGSR